MDRLFLDANVLFSAAYRSNAGLLALWKLKNVALYTSAYALEEAKVNLSEPHQKRRLSRLSQRLELVEADQFELPDSIYLPDKDKPILLAAIAARATHLITGDVHHFGNFFNKAIGGVLVVSPRAFP